MEVKIVDSSSYLVKLNSTESTFVNELALAGHCKPKKIIADLTFPAIIAAHGKLRYDEMMRTHEDHWDH